MTASFQSIPTIKLPPANSEIGEITLAQLTLPARYYKLLRKLEVTTGQPRTVSDLLAIQPETFKKFKAVGKRYISLLNELQNEIPAIAAKAHHGNSIPPPPPPQTAELLASFEIPDELSSKDVERILIEDFEQLIMQADNRTQTVALARWGYTVPIQKLEHMGAQFGVTRERIRQVEGKFNKRIPLSLRISSKALQAFIDLHIHEDLTELFPELAGLFTDTRLFYRFLEVCTECVEGKIQSVQYLERNGKERKALEDFWREMPSPTTPEFVVAELMNECGYSKTQAQQAVDRLLQAGALTSTKDGYYPKKLTQKAAVAHALIPHAKGLPWPDIARVVNASALSERVLPEDRLNQSIVNCESAYLCGRGCYRHLRYLPVRHDEVPGLLTKVRDQLIANGRKSANLPDLHRELAGDFTHDYFEIRHLVSTYGEEHCLYFDGTSSNDTVSITPEGERVRIREVILKLFRDSAEGLTLAEVASCIKSKSISLTKLYVSRLMRENMLVRVDEMIYTTPEKVFRQLDLDSIGRAMHGLIADTDLPIEADTLREVLNDQLGIHHSKHLYVAMGRHLSSQYGWHRKRTLFSREPIDYNGYVDLVRTVCDPSASNNANIDRLMRHVRVTHQMALLGLRWLRSEHRMSPDVEE